MDKLNSIMSTQNPTLLQKEKSLAEELTKSSSKLDSITVESEENFNDSIFGSISEGRDSILIQKVPYLECVVNHFPSLPVIETNQTCTEQ